MQACCQVMHQGRQPNNWCWPTNIMMRVSTLPRLVYMDNTWTTVRSQRNQVGFPSMQKEAGSQLNIKVKLMCSSGRQKAFAWRMILGKQLNYTTIVLKK